METISFVLMIVCFLLTVQTAKELKNHRSEYHQQRTIYFKEFGRSEAYNVAKNNYTTCILGIIFFLFLAGFFLTILIYSIW